MMLKKKVLIIMHNKVTSKQCFAATSAKRLEIFQASLKLVREAGAISLKTTTNTQHPKDQDIYEKEGTVNKNDVLI